METRTMGKSIVALIPINGILYNPTTHQFNQHLLTVLKAHGIRQIYLFCDFVECLEHDLKSIESNRGMAVDQIVKRCQEEHFIVRGVLSSIDLDPKAAPGEGYAVMYLPILEEAREKRSPTPPDYDAILGSFIASNCNLGIGAQQSFTTEMGLIYLKLLKELHYAFSAILYIDSEEKNLLGALSSDVAFANKQKQPELLKIVAIDPFQSEENFDAVTLELAVKECTSKSTLITGDLRLLQRDQFYFLMQQMANINPAIKYLSTSEFPLQTLRAEIEAIERNTALSPYAQITRFEKCVQLSFRNIVTRLAKPSYSTLFTQPKSLLQLLNEYPDHYHAERCLGLLLLQFYRRRHRLNEEFPWLREIKVPKGPLYHLLNRLPLTVPMLDVVTEPTGQEEIKIAPKMA